MSLTYETNDSFRTATSAITPHTVDAFEMGSTLVSLALAGSEGTFFSTLTESDPESTMDAVREVAFLYLHLAIADADRHASSDPLYVEKLFVAVRENLYERCFTIDPAEFHRLFERDFAQRHAVYSRCHRIFRDESSSFDATLMGEFFRSIAPLSRETRANILAQLQIETVCFEIARGLSAETCQ